jgi:hypothetical protein
MNKAPILILAVAISGIVFSCKKTYTCECKHKVNGGVGTTYDMKAYKRQAEEACSHTNSNFPDTTCNIK